MALKIYSEDMPKSKNDLIDPLTRIFILNIPTRIDNESLKNEFEKFGDIEVYAFQNCENDLGWAFIGYSSRRSVRRLIKNVYRNPSKTS